MNAPKDHLIIFWFYAIKTTAIYERYQMSRHRCISTSRRRVAATNYPRLALPLMGALRAARSDPPDTSPTHFADGRTARTSGQTSPQEGPREREGGHKKCKGSTKTINSVAATQKLLLSCHLQKCAPSIKCRARKTANISRG